MTITGVILAAGRGTRFGGDKLLAPLPNGITVIEQTVQRMSAAVDDYVCVLRGDDERLQQHLTRLSIPWTIAPLADQGMSQSLIAGIQHFPRADAWLIGLGDMPRVAAGTYQALCQRWREQQSLHMDDREGWIVVPAVREAGREVGVTVRGVETEGLRRGNPVLFSGQFKFELSLLTGDVGGKAVISGHPDRVLMVPVNDTGILLDIDTPEDVG